MSDAITVIAIADGRAKPGDRCKLKFTSFLPPEAGDMMMLPPNGKVVKILSVDGLWMEIEAVDKNYAIEIKKKDNCKIIPKQIVANE